VGFFGFLFLIYFLFILFYGVLLGVSFRFWDFDPGGFCCFIFVGWLFLCILPVYLEAPLRFFNKTFLGLVVSMYFLCT
jgi:hypothetical protein